MSGGVAVPECSGMPACSSGPGPAPVAVPWPALPRPWPVAEVGEAGGSCSSGCGSLQPWARRSNTFCRRHLVRAELPGLSMMAWSCVKKPSRVA